MSLYEQCRFCDLPKQQAGRVLAEYTFVTIVASNPRLMPGHLLVIPKRHVTHLHELTEAERQELFTVVVTLQQKILNRFASGCDIRQHNRPFLPENDLKVDHVHIHLQPREFEDEIYQKAMHHERSVFQPITKEELVMVRDKLFS